MRSAVLVVSASLLATTLAGCGGKSDDATPAAINGNKPAEQATPGGPSINPASSAAGAKAQDPFHPEVVVETSLGNITITLDAQNADRTVDSFLQYVDSGHYDGTIFHQVFAGYAILGGAFTPDYQEKEAIRKVFNQATNGLKNVRGTIAMARKADVIDSASCQFFINVSDNPSLDHQGQSPEQYGYCVFGKVSDGMDVVDKIASVPVKDVEQMEQTPVEPVLIKSIRRTR